MIIMKYWGGIGNQLFIYALQRELEYKGKTVKADIINLLDQANKEMPANFEIDKLGIQLDFVTDSDFYAIQRTIKQKIKWLKSIITGDNCKKYFYYFNMYEERSKVFDKGVLDLDNTFIFGYWQCPRYFEDVKDIIKSEITFPKYDHLSEEIKKFKECNSVSLHVRLGDYGKEQNSGFGRVCSVQYYRNAIDRIKEKVEKPVFFVFSNDVKEAEHVLSEIGLEYISMEGKSSIEDLYLMSNCKHHIIANSSYSWWGAWLGEDEDTIIVAPRIWHMERPEWDICEEHWETVDII